MNQLMLNAIFAGTRDQASVVSSTASARRLVLDLDCGIALVDEFPNFGAECLFLRIRNRQEPDLRLGLGGDYSVQACGEGGWLLRPNDGGEFAYWIPALPVFRKIDREGRIVSEQQAILQALNLGAGTLEVSFKNASGFEADCVIWRVPVDFGPLSGPVDGLRIPEGKAFFTWGSHSSYRRAADVYRHLVYGSVYEDRWAWPFRRRICSENDAHSLYVSLSGLGKANGNLCYRVLREQLVLSVMARQGSDGGWRHGEWTDGMESHYRLHCSGMHLLMDALSESADRGIREALTKAAEFIAKQSDSPGGGIWFLHDELEHGVENLRRGPFKWISSRALGKSESNMLVLNTQLDTIVALDRYRELTGDVRFQASVEKAKDTVIDVLRRKPAEWLYRPLFRAIGLTFLPTSEAQALPVLSRALKRVGWKYLIPLLPSIKSRFPRLVMPSGYIDRELTLKTWAHDYQTINLMDLLRFQRRFPQDDLTEIIGAGMHFVQASGIRGRWEELANKRYALGFWGEALYHACTQSNDMIYRAWLAEALLTLERLNLGVPPSILGANAEVVAPDCQIPCPVAADTRLLVANLCTSARSELIVVNPTEEILTCVLTYPSETRVPLDLNWFDSDGRPLPSIVQVPPKGWVRGSSARV